NDVQLDLRRPALDRVAARAQPLARERDLVLVEAGAVPAEPLRSRDPHRELVAILVQLGGVDLEQRALRPGAVTRLRGVAAALHGQVERALVHLELSDLVADQRVAELTLRAEPVLTRELHEPTALARPLLRAARRGAERIGDHRALVAEQCLRDGP